VPRNTRATNNYHKKFLLAYGINVFIKPEISDFFKDHGVSLDEDLYALSEMIQWIWRSRIREKDPKPIWVFIPSKRMRHLLRYWLSGEMSQKVAA
jgi:hypothetical protein